LKVERQLKALDQQQLLQHEKAVVTALIKELTSWLENKTCRPVRVADYLKRTGLKPIPSRWVIEFKEKLGEVVVKGRLCVKGFAERRADQLQTTSPTASRLGHRLVCLYSAVAKLPLVSLDVSTAFLQGWSFSELRESGFQRQPIAFTPPADVWKMLAELDPATYAQCLHNPGLWCLECDKAVYGLKDAPLLWHLRCTATLKELKLVQSPHDSCVWKLVVGGELKILMSLHVDDTLVTGDPAHITKLHKALEARFGTMKAESGQFKHFGVDVTKEPNFDVVLSQERYLSTLKPVEVLRKRGDGRLMESPALDAEVSDFRSLVSGVAWVGVTHPGA
jgi:hypothetical protein